MTITQIITQISDPPDTQDPANFDVRADDLFNNDLPQLVTELNVYKNQVNSTAADVNADALAAAQSVLDATEQAEIAEIAASVAVGAANYQGDYDPERLYQVGQSVTHLGQEYVAKTPNLGITPMDGMNWLFIPRLLLSNFVSGQDFVVDFSFDYVQATTAGLGQDIQNINFLTTKEIQKVDLIVETPGVNFDLRNAVYDNAASLIAPSAAPTGMTYNSDGTRLYIVDSSADRVYQYALATPYNPQTATYSNISFLFTAQASAVEDIKFNPTGTKMFLLEGRDNTGVDNAIFQYSLSTPFNVGTATYDNINIPSTGVAFSRAFAFIEGGSKILVLSDDFLVQISLPTPYILTGAILNGGQLDVGLQDNNTQDFSFNSDGTKLFILGSQNDRIYEYSLSTPYLVSSATYSGVSLLVSGQDINMTAILFNMEGSKIYALGPTADRIFRYSTNRFFPALNFPDFDASTPINPVVNSKNLYSFLTLNSGASYQLVYKNEGIV